VGSTPSGAASELKSRRYNLGPNGGILTALNLFTTKFDQVLSFVEKRAQTVEHVPSERIVRCAR
jgi:hypothetical protein